MTDRDTMQESIKRVKQMISNKYYKNGVNGLGNANIKYNEKSNNNI